MEGRYGSTATAIALRTQHTYIVARNEEASILERPEILQVTLGSLWMKSIEALVNSWNERRGEDEKSSNHKKQSKMFLFDREVHSNGKARVSIPIHHYLILEIECNEVKNFDIRQIDWFIQFSILLIRRKMKIHTCTAARSTHDQ